MLPEDIINSVFYIETMKRLERTGWNIAGHLITRKESIAEHTWGTLFLSWLLSLHLISVGESIDLTRVFSMAMLHDLPESIVSDIPHPALELGGEGMMGGKRHAEHASLHIILPPIDSIQQKSELILREFDEAISLESQIVKSADILDMMFHAVALERGGVPAKTLNQFFITGKKELDILDLSIATSIAKLLLTEHESNL